MSARSWNRIELMGNLTRDPELRYTPNGAAVCSFGMATNRSYMFEGERREEVDFHRLVAWNKLAELCSQLLKKGARVFISGRLQYREWETPEGQKRRESEIVIEDMILLTPKNSASYGDDAALGDDQAASPVPTPAPAQTAPSAVSDDTTVSDTVKPDPVPAKSDLAPAAGNPPTGNEEVGDLPF